MTGITELRVHGVSGTPAASMLQHPTPEQVIEGKLTGFYRRPRWSRREEMPGEQPVQGHHRRVEAYSWGNLTSGASTRALWLLLAPFALANMAAWMHPPCPERSTLTSGAAITKSPDDEPYGAHRFLWRLLALNLTLTLMLSAIGLGPDLVGWQCAARSGCANGHALTRFLAHGWWHQPSRAVTAAMLLPAVVLALLWWLGRQSWQRYEPPRPRRPQDEAVAPSERKAFWRGREIVGVLRSAHMAAALAVIAFFLAVPGEHGDSGTPRLVGIVIMSASVLLAVAAAVLVALPESRAVTKRPLPWQRAGRAEVVAGFAVVAAGLAYALWGQGPATLVQAEAPELPGFTGTLLVAFLTQLALLGLIVVAILCTPGIPEAPRKGRALFGLAGPILALFGIVVGTGVTAGSTIRFADWLGKPAQDSDITAATTANAQAVPIAVPNEYAWVALGLTAIAALVVIVLVLNFVRLRRNVHGQAEQVLAEQPYADALVGADDSTLRQARDRARQVVRARRIGGLLNDVGAWLVAPIAIGTAVAAVAAVVVYAADLVDPTTGWWSLVLTPATWLLTLLPIALVGVYRGVSASSSKRHTVGILWDLTTFWPRAIHPLAPPCYSERAVPDLVERMEILTEDGAVILSTHSQGTVLGVAAFLAAPEQVRRRTFMLTYGSPLCRLYSRYWPAYFGRHLLEEAADELAPSSPAPAAPQMPPGRRAYDPVDEGTVRWRNAWRRTDPIGGMMFPDHPARMVDTLALPDPAALTLRTGDIELPPVRGHSNYFYDEDFLWLADQAAERLATDLGPVLPPAPQPPQPAGDEPLPLDGAQQRGPADAPLSTQPRPTP